MERGTWYSTAPNWCRLKRNVCPVSILSYVSKLTEGAVAAQLQDHIAHIALDFSASFNTVSHNKLLSCLRSKPGIASTTLTWFEWEPLVSVVVELWGSTWGRVLAHFGLTSLLAACLASQEDILPRFTLALTTSSTCLSDLTALQSSQRNPCNARLHPRHQAMVT